MGGWMGLGVGCVCVDSRCPYRNPVEKGGQNVTALVSSLFVLKLGTRVTEGSSVVRIIRVVVKRARARAHAHTRTHA